MDLASIINQAKPYSHIKVLKGEYVVSTRNPIKIKEGLDITFDSGSTIKTVFDSNFKTDFFVLFEIFASKGKNIKDVKIQGNGLKVYGIGIKYLRYNWGMSIDINTNSAICRDILISGIKFINFGYAGLQFGGSGLNTNEANQVLKIVKIVKNTDDQNIIIEAQGKIDISYYSGSKKVIRINDGYFNLTSITSKGEIQILSLKKNKFCKETGSNYKISINDNVYIAGIPENILIDNVEFDRNYQHGCAITEGNNITFKNCKFSGTIGIDGVVTGFGMDIEPNLYNQISEIKIFDCEFIGNKRHGLYTHQANGLMAIIDTISGSKFVNNNQYGLALTQQFNNLILIDSCKFENNKGTGAHIEGNEILFFNNKSDNNNKFGAYIIGRDIVIRNFKSIRNSHNLQVENTKHDFNFQYQKESQLTIINSKFFDYKNSPNVAIYDIQVFIDNSLFELIDNNDIILDRIRLNSKIVNCEFKNVSTTLKKIQAFKNQKNVIEFKNNVYFKVNSEIE